MKQEGPLCHEHGIRGYGDPGYGVVLVGIAPGQDEYTRTKKPFTGPSGRLLDSTLKYAGWSRDKLYTTNTICWWNNTPSQQDIESCNVRLRHEIHSFKPKLIVTAGEIANEAITGAKRRKGSRGTVNWSAYWNAYVLDTHHPSFALQTQSADAVQDIIRDLTKIPIALDWPGNGQQAEVHYHSVGSIEEANQVLVKAAWADKDTTVSCDIETSNPDIESIDPYSDTLLCFAITFQVRGQKHTYVFPEELFPACVRTGTHTRAWIRNGGCPDCVLPRHVLNWQERDIRWLWQFGQYDIGGLYAYFGVRFRLDADTGLMSYCCDERPGHHGLKPNAREWLGAGWYEEGIKKFYKGRMHLLNKDDLHLYNAKDSRYTSDLEPVFMRRMQEDGTDEVYRNLLLPAMNTFIDMQVRGINVDQKRLQELAYEAWFPKYLTMFRDLQLEARDLGWPTDDINFNSNPQMQRMFFEVIGIEPTKLTKTGNPSVDKEVLDQMDHPFAAKLRGYRTLDTMIDYVLAVMKNLKYDGLLHPSAFVTTTRTGRTSYRDPAMQTLPKDYTVGEDYARLREIIVPHNVETHEIAEYDFNQIEVWLAWAESKDPILHEHLMSGDVHSATAEGAFKTRRDQWSKADWDVKRQNAKKIRFGIQYGEGPEKLSSPPPVGIGGTVADAKKFIAQYKASYPVYSKWMEQIQNKARADGFLRSPSGRVMRFPLVLDHRSLRQALNFPIQATASDYNLLSMIELAPLLRQYNSWIVLNIHDCLVIEQDRRYRSEIMALVKSVMQKEHFPGYPSIKVDCKIGDNLGIVKKIA